MDLSDLVAALAEADPETQAEIEGLVLPELSHLDWVPNPGPQTEAYYCEADELFYGGQAGGGKSDLLIGVAKNKHQSSLILRRLNKEVSGLIDRAAEIFGHRNGLNGQLGIWRIPKTDKTLTFGGCQTEEDKQGYKGRARDFYGFDEVSDFTQSQYEFIIGWNRSVIPGQRCRVIAAGNPPTRPEGLWVLRRWAAWLDPQHPNPAQPGELRWYTTGPDGEEVEVDGRGPHNLGGKPVLARSRTFIPAELDDNPDLCDTNYRASLDALPAELRAAYRDGNFGTTLQDDPYQIIPTAWVVEAQQRWTAQPPVGVPMCAIGVDVAIAKDNFVVACRHDHWFAPLLKIKGSEVDDPKKAAGRVVAMRRDDAMVIVDVGGGWGADCYAQLAANQITCAGYMGVKATRARSREGRFGFSNIRTEAIWKFREALDPSQPGGSPVALPPSVTLKADLCAPTYKVKGHGDGAVLIAESKEEVCNRLGRSTDEGDAVVMSYYRGIKQANIACGWDGHRGNPVIQRGKRYPH